METFNFDYTIIKSGGPLVTISSIGIAFNAVIKELLGNPQKIILGFDRERNVIGVSEYTGTDNKEKSIFDFASRVDKYGWVRISMRDFIKYLSQVTNIDFTTAIRFIPDFDVENKMLIITVDKEHMKIKDKNLPDNLSNNDII